MAAFLSSLYSETGMRWEVVDCLNLLEQNFHVLVAFLLFQLLDDLFEGHGLVFFRFADFDL